MGLITPKHERKYSEHLRGYFFDIYMKERAVGVLPCSIRGDAVDITSGL